MNVHVLTPYIRGENIAAIAASLEAAQANAPHVRVVWHLERDPWRSSPGGYAIRNAMIDAIDRPNDWIWPLDDDTVAHPNIFARLGSLSPNVEALVVAQSRPARWGPDSGCADPARLVNGAHQIPPGGCGFDIGQAIFRRRLVGGYRYRLERPGDGYFYEDVLAGADGVVYWDEILSHYNALRPTEAG